MYTHCPSLRFHFRALLNIMSFFPYGLTSLYYNTLLLQTRTNTKNCKRLKTTWSFGITQRYGVYNAADHENHRKI